MDAEYYTALAREPGADGHENLEAAWLVGLALQLGDPLELAVRYEVFDDDRSGEQDHMLDDRWLVGFNYALSDSVTPSSEYRLSRFEHEAGSIAVAVSNELAFQSALEF